MVSYQRIQVMIRVASGKSGGPISPLNSFTGPILTNNSLLIWGQLYKMLSV